MLIARWQFFLKASLYLDVILLNHIVSCPGLGKIRPKLTKFEINCFMIMNFETQNPKYEKKDKS